MSLDPNIALFVATGFAAIAFILIMFLPAVLELKRPQDSRPRAINEDAGLQSQSQEALFAMEKDMKVDPSAISRVASVLSILPNVEG